ncbi:MAG: carboxypeptidase regulatory-like domain-containing protein [Nitrospirota bacterium]
MVVFGILLLFSKSAIASSDVASWIISCQRPTGAICTDASQSKIIPYKANIAAMGLLKEEGTASVKAWIEWYFAHLEPWGTIYDYKVEDGSEISLNSAQAEDSYSGSFLTLLKRYYEVTLDVDFFESYQSQLLNIAIYLGFCLPDGGDYLTWTGLDMVEKLLMNNTQSYRGLKDYASLYFDLNFSDSRDERDIYNTKANLIQEGIGTELWNEAQGWHYWEKDNSGNKTDCDWTTICPDAVSQLYTILNNVNLPESSRSLTLYNKFNNQQPNWTNPALGTNSYCEIGYAAGLMADTTNAQIYKNSITDNVINQGYPSPWDCQDAGFYLLMKNRLKELEKIEPLLAKSKELGLNFLTSGMQRAFGGIQAQFDNTWEPSQVGGVNHEVTSEATGQALLYAAGIQDKGFFNDQFKVLTDNHLSDTYNLLVWKLTPNGDWWQNEWDNYGNAVIDDLRAIRALLLAYDTWGDASYLAYANSLAQGLKDHNVINYKLRDYFSWGDFEGTSQNVVLSYLDLLTMKRLAGFDSDWENILQTNKQIILGGTTTVGLYYPRYSYGGYCGDTISMIHGAWISENLARYWKETGDVDCRTAAEKFLNFAKNEYANHTVIFGEYDVITGVPTVGYEDTAIYSIIARLAFVLGDFVFAKNLRDNKILNHQNKDIKSLTVGCFGYDYENPYAFVCFESLLAILGLEDKEEYLLRGKVTAANKPIKGVLLTLSGTTLATTTTNSNGEYKLSGQPDGSYTITPSKQGYKFGSTQISPLNKHYDNLDFEGSCGKITSVSPTSGTIGMTITITGEDFDGEERIRISFGEIVTVTMITSHPLGDFSTTFTVPAQSSGTITICASGGSVTGINYFFLRALDHFKIGTINSQIVNQGFEITIYPLDARNTIFEYSGTVSLSDDSNTIFPIKTTSFPYGTWTGSVIITKAGTTTIKVEAENKIVTSNPFLVQPAQINKLVFITQPQTVPAGNSTGLIVFQTQDEFGNPANTQNDVAIQLLSLSLKRSFSLTQSPWIDTNTVTLTCGTNTDWFYYLNTLAGTHTITIKEEPSLGWVAGTQAVRVNPGQLEHFDFNTVTTQQAGTEFQIEMMAKDVFDNTVDFTGTVSLSGGQITPETATFTAGRATCSVTIIKSGTLAIVANFGSNTGTSNAFWVNPAPLHHFAIGTITSQIAGEVFTIKITALDTYDNPATYSDTASLKAKGIFPATITFTEGIWEGTVTITKAGTISITVLAEGKTGTSNQFWVSPSPLNHFTLGTISSQEAGKEFEVTITAMDAYENIATYTGTAYLQDITQTIFPKTATFTNGNWQGTVTITKSGTTAITVSYQDKAGTSNSFFVTPAALDHFIIGTITNQTAGTTFTITITAKDSFGNIADGFTGIADLILSPPQSKIQNPKSKILSPLNPTTTTNFTTGIWQGTVSITKAGTTCIFATADDKTGTSNPFYINPNTIHEIVIEPSEIELEIEDKYKFEASGFDKYGNKLDELDYTWKTLIGNVEPTSGTWTLFKATITTTIGTLTAGYGTIIGYATISLKSGALNYIIITPQIATVTVGESKTFMAKGYDKYGNEEFINGGTWTLESWMGSIVPWTGTQTNFYVGVKSGYGTINYLNQMRATAIITILPGTHTRFKIGTVSSPQSAGIPFNITITAVDSYNNPIENYIGGVNLSYAAGKIEPEIITNFTAGIWTGTITVEKTGEDVTITAVDSGSATLKGVSNAFNVQPSVLHHFNISEPAPTYIINSKIPLVITAEDTYGNILTNYNGTFSLTEETQTIYPKEGRCLSGRFIGSVTISKAKPHIKITVTTTDKFGISDSFTTLIDDESGGKITGDVGDEKTSIEIAKQTLWTDFYITIDPKPEQQHLEINLANFALSHDPTSRGITNSLHLFQAYDKDDKPIQPGTNSFILISLPYPDENQDEFVDYPEVRINEQTLKIYELKNSRWVEVKNGTVHPYENIVSAKITNFGVYMLIGQIIPANLDILKVYPNPFKPIRGDSEIVFDGLPPNTTIRIYDISASLIKEIENISTGSYKWDVRDAYGKNVASGIYIYIISNDEDMKKIGKIAIIR